MSNRMSFVAMMLALGSFATGTPLLAAEPKEMSLDDCVRTALQNSKPIHDQFSLQMIAEDTIARVLDVDRRAGAEINLIGLIDNVTRAYWEQSLFEQNLRLTESARDTAKLAWDDTKRRGGQQEAQCREQYYFFNSKVADAETDHQKSNARLCTLLGVDPDEHAIRTTDHPDRVDALPLFELLRPAALESSAVVIEKRRLIAELSERRPGTTVAAEDGMRLVLVKRQLTEIEGEIEQLLRDSLLDLERSQADLDRAITQRDEAKRTLLLASETTLATSAQLDWDKVLDAQRRCVESEVRQILAQANFALSVTTVRRRAGTLLLHHRISVRP